MLRGFYTAANGMITQQRQQEAFANNISNTNTPGYKADQTTLRAFPEMLLHQMSGKKLPVQNKPNVPFQQPIGSLNTGVYVQEMIPNFEQGDVQETGLSTDFALTQRDLPDESGALFFTVQNESGDVRYTRNGNFTVDGAGFLVTNEGYYVLDENGEPIETNDMDFTVTSDGLLQTADGATALGIAYSTDANTMVKEGNNVYTGDVEAVPAEAIYSVKQGFLERSNVDALQAMTQMMESYRLFETNQRVLKAYDQSMEKAVSEIGRLV
ncbi:MULTISPECIES: flagellar hook-basal body protein [Virgibacillus]|uniref:Flagellar hook-basal body protein n=1 Tax=Virgibacillus dokdonensis TaxID=302167 RepID=A0ABU7VGW1_9BACI|nr:flagellar hook-basal body protein [Virgibacillus sp.]NWO12880.1 flagellar hook-basal body protein [Virgibacillus sp.]